MIYSAILAINSDEHSKCKTAIVLLVNESEYHVYRNKDTKLWQRRAGMDR